MRVHPGAEEGRHSAFQAGRIQSKEGMVRWLSRVGKVKVRESTFMKSTKTRKLGKLTPRYQLSWSPKVQDPRKSFSKPWAAASHKPLPSTARRFGRYPPKCSSKFSQLLDAIRFFCYLLKSSNNTRKNTAEFSLGAHDTVQKGLEHATPQLYSNSSRI